MSQEDFDLASLARYLKKTPEQIRKMADRDRLPGRRVGGEWRFAQADIHHWMEEQIGASDEAELVQVEKLLGESETEADSVRQLLREEAIEVPLAARTKRSVISRLCQLAMETGLLWDPGKMEEAILAREQLHSTALHNGVALLHSRRPMSGIIGEPFLGLGITGSGIPFGGPRGNLTDVFFLIGSTEESQHLRTLARISRLIFEPEFLEQLRSSASSSDAVRVVCDFDSELS